MKNTAKVTNDIIRQRLIQEIDESGLTYFEIAKRVGVSATMITQYKTRKMPSLETFARICEVLDLDANYILGLKVY